MPMTISPPPVFAKAQTCAASPSQRCSRVLSRYPDMDLSRTATVRDYFVRRGVRRILSCLGNHGGDWQQDITGYRHWLLRPDLQREYVRGSSNSQTHSSYPEVFFYTSS